MGDTKEGDQRLSLFSGRFSGTMKAVRDADGWRGEIDGRIADLDFGHELGERFSHRLMTVGEITLRRRCSAPGGSSMRAATWSPGRASSASHSYLRQPPRLDLQRVGRASTPGDVIEFDQMAFDFRRRCGGPGDQGAVQRHTPGGAIGTTRQALAAGSQRSIRSAGSTDPSARAGERAARPRGARDRGAIANSAGAAGGATVKQRWRARETKREPR